MSWLSSAIGKLPGGNIINSIGQSAINVAVSAVPYGSTINSVAQNVGNSIFHSAAQAGAETASASFLDLATRADQYATSSTTRSSPASPDTSQLLMLGGLALAAYLVLKD